MINQTFFDRVNIGDVISGSLHYNYLCSAYFFLVKEKRGKATLICDLLANNIDYPDHSTKVISCEPIQVIQTDIKLRAGKWGAKYDGISIHSFRKEYSGSASD